MKTATKAKIYQYAPCPFSWKVKALMAYKNIPYETVEVHPLNKNEISFSENYKKVPILVDANGIQVNDSTAIMRHLDEQYPEKPVFEQDEEAKTYEEKWLRWADNTLAKALPPVIYDNYGHSLSAFNYITKVAKFSWWQKAMIKYSGAFAMTMVAKRSAKRMGIENPGHHLKECLREWELALDGREFLGGSSPNAADLAIYGILTSINDLPVFSSVKENAGVFHWIHRMENKIEEAHVS